MSAQRWSSNWPQATRLRNSATLGAPEALRYELHGFVSAELGDDFKIENRDVVKLLS